MLIQLRDKLSKKGPFVVILKGTNQGKVCYTGIYSSQPLPQIPDQISTSQDQQFNIPKADDNFIFYYEDGYSLHFDIPKENSNDWFGQVQTYYDGGGALSFYHSNNERIYVSFSPQTSYVDINLYDMKPQEEDKNQTYPADIPAEFVF